MKIRELKGAPLLAQPPADTLPPWLKLSQDDMRQIMRRLEGTKKRDDAEAVLLLSYQLVKSGVITPTDMDLAQLKRLGDVTLEKKMGEKTQLEHEKGLALAQTFFLMNELRVPATPKSIEQEAISHSLAIARKNGDGESIAAHLHWAPTAKVKCRMTKEDRKALLETLEGAHRGHAVRQMMEIYAHAGAIGLEAEPTADDAEMFRAYFQGASGGANVDALVFSYHVLAGLLRKRAKPVENPPIPPIRRLRR